MQFITVSLTSFVQIADLKVHYEDYFRPRKLTLHQRPHSPPQTYFIMWYNQSGLILYTYLLKDNQEERLQWSISFDNLLQARFWLFTENFQCIQIAEVTDAKRW